MLFLLFQLGHDRYALDAGRIVEVVPFLALKRVPQSPRGMAGLFVYRGRAVPALDLCALTFDRPARQLLSTRIIIVNSGEAPEEEQLLGLIVERATDTLRREASDLVEAGIKLAGTPFLGPVLMDEHGVIQLIHAHKLLTDRVRAQLFNSLTEVGHETH
ncbi:MAG: chemotaxis protein CheW [Verrucomicrobiae bacterium]|nr:chemotaxis protein CheW [Verrucomicrobiae bacterium]